MKRVLLPTDFSDGAWNAIQYAVMLLQHKKCTFYILNVFSVPFTTANMMAPEPGNPSYDEASKKSNEKLKIILKKLKSKENPRHHFILESKNNFLIDAINNIVEQNAIDLIIMGTKGVKNIKGTSYGSNAVAVMEKTMNCPVVVVPEKANFKGLKEVVFPTSYEFASKSGEIKTFIDFIKDYESTIKILHINENEELSNTQIENKKLLEEKLSGLEYTVHALTNIEPALGVSCFAQSREADLIALVNRKHSFFYRLMEKQTLKGISHYSNIPLLIMHHS